MTPRTIAARYARALLDVASKEADLETVKTELDEFLGLLKAHPELQRVLMNPAVPVPRKKAAVTDLTALAGQSAVVSKLLIMLAERDRLTLLPDLVAVYHDLLMDRQGVVRAEVISSEPLPQERVDAITASLASLTGKQVSMMTSVNREILGGLVARVGSTVYDASVATQLKKIRERLTT